MKFVDKPAKGFIMSFDDMFSDQWCADAIKYFENMNHAGFGFGREFAGQSSLIANDTSVVPVQEHLINLDGTVKLGAEFNEKLWQAWDMYASKFPEMETWRLGNFTTKLQRTLPTEGYHVWHSEKGNLGTASRIATYLLYLNDVEKGGETEFLYQSKRIKPKTGRLIIFPAGYTHTHRGNPPMKGAKYVITGWFEFVG